MKRTLTDLALLAGLASQSSFATLRRVAPNWTGTWSDANGGLMVMLDSKSGVEAKSGAVDVSGADRGSMYRLLCTPEAQYASTLLCAGDGINYEQANNPKRFTYRSKLIHQDDGGISEEWECVFDADRRNGKSLFKRVSSTTR